MVAPEWHLGGRRRALRGAPRLWERLGFLRRCRRGPAPGALTDRMQGTRVLATCHRHSPHPLLFGWMMPGERHLLTDAFLVWRTKVSVLSSRRGATRCVCSGAGGATSVCSFSFSPLTSHYQTAVFLQNHLGFSFHYISPLCPLKLALTSHWSPAPVTHLSPLRPYVASPRSPAMCRGLGHAWLLGDPSSPSCPRATHSLSLLPSGTRKPCSSSNGRRSPAALTLTQGETLATFRCAVDHC